MFRCLSQERSFKAGVPPPISQVRIVKAGGEIPISPQILGGAEMEVNVRYKDLGLYHIDLDYLKRQKDHLHYNHEFHNNHSRTH